MPGRCPLCNAEAEVEQQCGGSKASTLVSHLLDVHGYMRCEICDGEVYIDKTSIPTHIHNPQQPVHVQQQHVHVQQQDAQIPQIQKTKTFLRKRSVAEEENEDEPKRSKRILLQVAGSNPEIEDRSRSVSVRQYLVRRNVPVHGNQVKSKIRTRTISSSQSREQSEIGEQSEIREQSDIREQTKMSEKTKRREQTERKVKNKGRRQTLSRDRTKIMEQTRGTESTEIRESTETSDNIIIRERNKVPEQTENREHILSSANANAESIEQNEPSDKVDGVGITKRDKFINPLSLTSGVYSRPTKYDRDSLGSFWHYAILECLACTIRPSRKFHSNSSWAQHLKLKHSNLTRGEYINKFGEPDITKFKHRCYICRK